KDQYNVDIRAINILLQGLPKDIYTLINHYTDAKDIWDNVKMLLEGSELTKVYRESQLYDDFEHFRQHKGELIHDYYVSSSAEDLIENLTNTLALLTQSYITFLPQTNNQLRTSSNARNEAIVQDGRVVVQNVQGRPNRGQGMNPLGGSAARYRELRIELGMSIRVKQDHDNAFDDDVDEQPIQDLVLNVDNVFQADDCDAFDSDVDEAPTVQTMFMANLLSVDPVTDEAGQSYDSDILSEVPNCEHYQDAACAHHERHVTHDSVQLDHVIDSHADYTSDSNMISYDQYVKDNEVPVVHIDASSVPIDTFMMIYNDMCESPDQSVPNLSRNTVVKNSLTAELATYKEHVEL
nr:hypothetical protein [Tanacetum cinerariifolium]